MVNEQARELLEDERKAFHRTVAKLLYLSKRARPDILTVVSFLCTRVSVATEEDAAKLHHLLGYLQYTKEKSLTLKPQGILTVETHIDAAFASHQDSKSHSGIAMFIGGAFVFGASRKQKCITKSPTESELVAFTDNISFVELFAEFFAFIINEDVNADDLSGQYICHFVDYQGWWCHEDEAPTHEDEFGERSTGNIQDYCQVFTYVEDD